MTTMYTIGASKIHGRGVIAARDIPAGADVGLGIRMLLGFVPFVTGDLGRWINHSSRPTAGLTWGDGGWRIVALARIPRGSEVTVDYDNTPWYVMGAHPSWK
jgi:SET domain-containing protein